ncbi:MAG: hydantoinase/oxoprolinase family protein [Gammaproteobacteria bacterium]|nr:hydantoinase/oxoprolinase family protein [Gammaproteobacteria bacterium]
MNRPDSTVLQLGIDTGGTFTDFVLFDGQSLRIHKVLSTPQAPEQAILQGIREMGLSTDRLQVVHGSTVATNAVLEHKGVRTVYIANRGLGDVLTIGRQARRELYNLQPEPPLPPVPRELCLEVGARMGADGKRISAFSPQDKDALLAALREIRPDAVAINLLFSFLDDSDERAIEECLPDGLFVSRSSEVLPEYKEYERGIATWLNAWIGPLVAGYLERLVKELSPAPVAVMQSSGGTVSAARAGSKAVQLLLSGPAGGLTGARFIGQQAGQSRLLTFDMGGTSTDVALIDGGIQLTSEGRIGRWPVAVPMVDMHTIGAGGGSIASIDSGGLLRVGPESAGAVPGPACYGQGGQTATVTDANLVLGRLQPDAFLGGAMTLDRVAATAVVGKLAAQLQMGVEAAALGIVALANEHMAQALRVISVQRGVDPRQYVLVSFGGAGGLHVCALAEVLGMSRVLVPVHAGVLSALGMLAAARSRQLSRTVTGLLEAFSEGALVEQLHTLAAAGTDELLVEGVEAADINTDFSLDLRYRGQSYTLNLPWQGLAATGAAFHAAHEQRYGHRLPAPIELVNLRCGLRSSPPDIRLPEIRVGKPVAAVPEQVTIAGQADSISAWSRAALCAGQEIVGPALVTETVATTWLPDGWSCKVDPVGNLLLEHDRSPGSVT